MIHEPAKWAGWQSTTAAAQHLDRLKQMQNQIYRILSERSGKPLRQIIRDTKRTDFYLDASKAQDYGLIDGVLGPAGGWSWRRTRAQASPSPSPNPWSRPTSRRRSGPPTPHHADLASRAHRAGGTRVAKQPDRGCRLRDTGVLNHS